MEEDGSFPDYDGDEIGHVTTTTTTTQATVLFPLTEKPRSASLVTDQSSRPRFPLLSQTTTTTEKSSRDIIIGHVGFSYKAFVSRTWALIVLTLAVLGFSLSMWMLVYVLLKICDGTLSGQQAMGLMLMVGVTGLFGSVVPWVISLHV